MVKKGFYMGYDASALEARQILDQARLLLDGGFYRAGYQVIRLGEVFDADGVPAGRVEDPAALSRRLRAMGFSLDVTLNAAMPAPQALNCAEALGAQRVTLRGSRADVEGLAAAFAGRAAISVCAGEDDLTWAAGIADTVILDALTDDADFFEITRNQLDSCRDGDTDIAASRANLRADAMAAGGAYQVGNLVCRFDEYRNAAIFAQMVMLGVPLVIGGDVAALPAAFARLIQEEKLLDVARRGLGRTARYYDPWHVLLTKPMGPDAACALVLNRCHGDQPTNLLPADVGWDCRFSLRELPEDTLVGANLETFEVHVETSDHPQTPCCRLYRMEKVG